MGMRNTTQWLPASLHACGPQVPWEEFQIGGRSWRSCLRVCIDHQPLPETWTFSLNNMQRVLLPSLFFVFLASHLHLKSSRTKMNKHQDNKTNKTSEQGKKMNKTPWGAINLNKYSTENLSLQPRPRHPSKKTKSSEVQLCGFSWSVHCGDCHGQFTVATVMVSSLWWLSWSVYYGDCHGQFTVVTVMVSSLWWLSWSVYYGDCHGQLTVMTVMVSSLWWLSWWVYCGDSRGQFTAVIIRTELISKVS